MSSQASIPSEFSPATTLAIILGANQFPRHDLPSPPSFERSAHDFRDYLLARDGLSLPEDNLLDLFDADDHPAEIYARIRSFIAARSSSLGKVGANPRDLIFYYVGHGGFSDHDQQYYLAIRRTTKDFEGISSVRILELAPTLTEKAASGIRRYLILDCCFAAAAIKMLQAPISEVVKQKTFDRLPPEARPYYAHRAHTTTPPPRPNCHTRCFPVLCFPFWLKATRQSKPASRYITSAT